METTHTPGPWRLEGEAIFALGNLPIRLEYGAHWCSKPEREANARLIAAAPDLLAALRELIDATPTPLHNQRQRAAFDAACAALAKADGKE